MWKLIYEIYVAGYQKNFKALSKMQGTGIICMRKAHLISDSSVKPQQNPNW